VGQFEEALEHFNMVLRIGGRDAATFAAKGLTLMEIGDLTAAAVALHEALAVSPQDAVATQLLGRCMKDFEGEGMDLLADGGAEEDDEFERRFGEVAERFQRRGRRGRRIGRVEESSEVGGSLMEDESMVVDEDDD
jgi:anaphase-promoting complex subunit 6